jgi:hypothetical protein
VANKSLTNVPEQDHESMRAAAMRPIAAPSAMREQAAGGGNEVPGREPRELDVPVTGLDTPHEPIPGERDPTTAMRRQPGSIGTPFNGEGVDVDLERTLDDRTAKEHRWEGGGRR